jgi:hypothetical protein
MAENDRPESIIHKAVNFISGNVIFTIPALIPMFSCCATPTASQFFPGNVSTRILMKSKRFVWLVSAIDCHEYPLRSNAWKRFECSRLAHAI